MTLTLRSHWRRIRRLDSLRFGTRGKEAWYSLDRMAEVQLQSTLTCPHCRHQATEIMPTDACVAFYDCKGSGKTLKPLPGSCCVFCSYGSVPCPPIQQGVEPCCTPIPDKRSQDWLGNVCASLLAWWGLGFTGKCANADGHLGH